MALLPLDGPSAQNSVSVTTAAVVEAKAGVTTFSERKALTLQPLTDDIYVYFGDDSGAPSATTVQAKGFIIYSTEKVTYEASDSQKLYLLAVNATTNVIIAERA